MSEATDLVVRYEGEPQALDDTVQALPGFVGAVVQGAAAPGYARTEDGFLRVRVFGDPAIARVMLIGQGYVQEIVREERVA